MTLIRNGFLVEQLMTSMPDSIFRGNNFFQFWDQAGTANESNNLADRNNHCRAEAVKISIGPLDVANQHLPLWTCRKPLTVKLSGRRLAVSGQP